MMPSMTELKPFCFVTTDAIDAVSSAVVSAAAASGGGGSGSGGARVQEPQFRRIMDDHFDHYKRPASRYAVTIAHAKKQEVVKT